MRIGFQTVYQNMQVSQQQTQNNLTDITKQLSSGKKIQYGYEGSSTFVETLRLDYEELTLQQGIDVSDRAKKFSDNTDTTLSQFSTTLDNFKQKLVQAGNEIHSDESLAALADDMEAMKNHFIALANTSIGGEYIFSGTAVNTAPIGNDGKYYGNNQSMQGLVSTNNLLTYNITGQEMFYGKDSDVSRKVTTNIKKLNQESLHPEIMTKENKGEISKEVFITETDTLRAYLGDSNDNTTDNETEYFYLRGRKPDGTTFSSKFEFDINYTNKDNAATVRDLLDRIGKEYGNTAISKVVDVSLNAWGQIEITDLRVGSSNLDFHMISASGAKGDVTNTDELLSNGAHVTEYIKGNFYAEKVSDSVSTLQDNYDHRIHTLATTLKKGDNSVAKPLDTLSDVLGANITDLTFGGNKINNSDGSAGSAVGPLSLVSDLGLTMSSTIEDLMGALKTAYSSDGTGNDIDVDLVNGKLVFFDTNVQNLTNEQFEPPYDGPSSFSFTMESVGGDAFSNDYTVEYDKVRFQKNGSYLTSNVPQVVKSNSNYATASTKLSEVAGTSLDGQTYKMEVTDTKGVEYIVNVNFSNTLPNGSEFEIVEKSTGTSYGPYTIYNPLDDPISAATADDMTYKQLNDVISIATTFSTLNPGSLPGNGLNAVGKAAYESALTAAQYLVDVKLDYNGTITIKDLKNSSTKLEFSIYDENTSMFDTANRHRPGLTFNANNALTIDDPHVDFFTTIDNIITAVRNNIYRPDGFNADGDFDYFTRNTGIQNSLEIIDHLQNHINKIHAKNGAQGNAFSYALEKNEALVMQVKTLRSYVLDADVAETTMKFSQLTLNYQAMLSSVSKITKLSLVNYI